jgi:hypothetical protein
MKLAVFVKALRNSVDVETLRVAHIMSLDETIQSFRCSMGALFLGEVPDQLMVAGADGRAVIMQDSAHLSHYHLLCFQVVNALFLPPKDHILTSAQASRDTCPMADTPLLSPSPKNENVSASPGPAAAVESLAVLKCAGKVFPTFSFNMRIAWHPNICLSSDHNCFTGCAALLPLRDFSNSQVA